MRQWVIVLKGWGRGRRPSWRGVNTRRRSPIAIYLYVFIFYVQKYHLFYLIQYIHRSWNRPNTHQKCSLCESGWECTRASGKAGSWVTWPPLTLTPTTSWSSPYRPRRSSPWTHARARSRLGVAWRRGCTRSTSRWRMASTAAPAWWPSRSSLWCRTCFRARPISGKLQFFILMVDSNKNILSFYTTDVLVQQHKVSDGGTTSSVLIGFVIFRPEFCRYCCRAVYCTICLIKVVFFKFVYLTQKSIKEVNLFICILLVVIENVRVKRINICILHIIS